MTQFVIMYSGGDQPSSPEEGKQHFIKYKQWLSSLGDAVVSPMNPLMNTQTISSDGSVSAGSKAEISGFTIIDAVSLEEALTMVKNCPFLDIGGSLEVAELIKMPA